MEALQRLHNRGSISTGYNIDNSVKLEDANNEWLYRASPTAGNRRTYTFSFWIKRTELGLVNGSGNQFMIGQGQHGRMYFGSEYFQYRFDDGHDCRNVSRQFRDTSAWYHFVVAVDTNQSSASNRVKLYVNGESLAVDDHDGGSYPDIEDSGAYFSTSYLTIGTAPFGGSYNAGDGSYDMSGYLAEFCGIDGTQYAPTDFGEFDEDSGIWKPKDLSDITWGSEGYYLKFDDSSALGADSSGNGNNFTLNNISAADQAVDTPTNNFCTLVGDQQFVPSKSTTLVREGGTIMHGGQNPGAYSTMGVRRGKWYFESTLLHLGGVGAENHGFGVIAADRLYDMNIAGEDIGADVGGWACAGNANPRNNNSGASGANYLTAPGINVVLGCALDMDNGKIWWHNAGTWHSLNSTVGNPANGTSPAWSNLLTATDDFVLPAAGLYANGAGPERAMNFGGYALPAFTAVGTYSDANGYGSFSYAPPSGYYALCTKNLEEYG
jgi:hypothetical protein